MTKKLRVGDKVKGSWRDFDGKRFSEIREVIAKGKFRGERWALFYVSEDGESDGELLALRGSDLKAVEREAEAQIEGLWEEE